MIKFKPISYNKDDLRAYKYTSGSSVLEGIFCEIAASSSLNTVTCTLFSAAGTLPAINGTIYNTGAYFPIYREDADIENVGATIVRDNFVIGMHLRPGSMFEIHRTATHGATLLTYPAIGAKVALATSGKLVSADNSSSSGVVVGLCVGTTNDWLRVQAV